MKAIFGLLLAVILFPLARLGAETPGDAILGVWNTTDDKSRVEIFKKDNHYFAKILSLKEPNWPANDKEGKGGKPKNDRGNPKPELRNRPIVGLQFMNDFVYQGKNLWADGKIYDPESGKTYSCKLTLTKSKELEVRGFVGISLLGRTEIWKR
jgi:uncharacterized protein (DUF2147 family)